MTTKTYCMCSDVGLDDRENTIFLSTVKKEFDKYFREISLSKLKTYNNPKLLGYVDFMFVYNTTGKITKQYNSIECIIKNSLDGIDNITNKCKLHMSIMSSSSEVKQYISHTTLLNEVTSIKKGDILIVRPCARWANSGKGIVRVSTNQQLVDEKAKYSKLKMSTKNLEMIASLYIRNPVLLHDKKTHFRMFMLVTEYPNNKYYLFKYGKIRTALKKYVDKNYDDNDIHDTHMHSTEHDYIFPIDIDKLTPKISYDDVIMQMKKICEYLFELIKDTVKPYPESKHGYNVFGIDFMIDTYSRVYLIECNGNPGYQNIDDDNKNFRLFAKKYVKWVYKNAIEPIFDNKNT